MPRPKFYAYVIPAKEKQGIAETWEECERHVKGVTGARYRSFPSREAAAEWLHSGGEYESRPRREKSELLPGVYFDAGTGRGEGVEISVTDEKGENLLPRVLSRTKLNRFGKHLVAHVDATNNYGELLALKYALKYAIKEEEKSVFGDSKLVIDFWSKYQIKRKEVSPRTVKLAEEVSKLREKFEGLGGVISRVSGADNPADLGFHR
jgi:ribonuclease HI